MDHQLLRSKSGIGIIIGSYCRFHLFAAALDCQLSPPCDSIQSPLPCLMWCN